MVKRYVAAMIRDAKTEEGLTEENFKVGTVSGQYQYLPQVTKMYLSKHRDCSAVGIILYGFFSVIVLFFWHKELLAALISVILSRNKHSKEPAQYQTYWSIWLLKSRYFSKEFVEPERRVNVGHLTGGHKQLQMHANVSLLLMGASST